MDFDRHAPKSARAWRSICCITYCSGSSSENREYEVGKKEGYEESVRNESQIKM